MSRPPTVKPNVPSRQETEARRLSVAVMTRPANVPANVGDGIEEEEHLVDFAGHELRPGCCCCCGEVQMVSDGDGPAHPHDGCEERCCRAFWHDDQPPNLPVLHWVFDPSNTHLNDNRRCHIFGNVGLPYADQHRKEIMGTALGITVVSIIITIYGCFGALATDRTTILLTHWVSLHTVVNGTGWAAYMGLRTVVTRVCKVRASSVQRRPSSPPHRARHIAMPDGSERVAASHL